MRHILLLLLTLPVFSFAQPLDRNAHIDSLKSVIESGAHDSIIIKTMFEWDNMIYTSDPQLDLELSRKIYKICSKQLSKKLNKKEKFFFQKSFANSLNSLGILYYQKGRYAEAIDRYSRSVETSKELDDKKSVGNSFNNIGSVYKEYGDYATAINYYTQGLKVREKIEDKKGVSSSLNNIGVVYLEQDIHAKALEYFKKCLKIRVEIGDKRGSSVCLNNIGLAYSELKDHVNAIYYYKRSLKASEDFGHKNETASTLSNIGIIYRDNKEYSEAINYFRRSLDIGNNTDNKKTVAIALNHIGIVHYKQGNYAKAIDYSSRSLKLAQEIENIAGIRNATKSLWKAYKKTRQSQESLAMYELYVKSRDKIKSDENQQEIIHQEYKYTYDKQVIQDSLLRVKEKAISAKEIEKKNVMIAKGKIQNWLLIVGVCLFIALFFIAYRSYFLKRKDALNKHKDLENMSLRARRERVWADKLVQLNKRIQNGSTANAQEQIQAIVEDIKNSLVLDEKHKLVNENIDILSSEFKNKLMNKFPNLNSGEIEMCELIRLGLSNTEIARIRNINQDSARKARSRLRGKLGLTTQDSIEQVLSEM